MGKFRVLNASRSQVDHATGLLVMDNNGDGSGGYVLPQASPTTLGGIKVGKNLTVTGGILDANDQVGYDDGELRTAVADNAADVQGILDVLPGKQETLVSAVNLKTVNGASLLGPGNLVVGGEGSVAYDDTAIRAEIANKQDVLVPVPSAGQNIKTINGQVILGQGDIVIGGGSSYTLPAADMFTRGGVRVGGPGSNASMQGDALVVDDMRYDDTELRGLIAQGGGGGSAPKTHPFPVSYPAFESTDASYSVTVLLQDPVTRADIATFLQAESQAVETETQLRLKMVFSLTKDVISGDVVSAFNLTFSPKTLIPNPFLTAQFVYQGYQAPDHLGLLMLSIGSSRTGTTATGTSKALYANDWVVLNMVFDKIKVEPIP